MTQEEKAKAYDEALEKAKAHINSKGIGDTVDLCKHLFSELHESEDERIRKAIIRSIEEDSSVYEQEVSKEQMLAWLEKQKEPTKEELYAEAGTTENEYIANTMKMVRAMREKQKEQKPAWSEEDEEIREEVIGDLCALKDWIIKYDANWLANPVLKNIDKRISWLKSLRPSWKPSEEQLNALNFAITYFMHETNYKNPTELRELYDELLKLK